MIDFKKFRLGKKKEQQEATPPADSFHVEQDVVELDLDDRPANSDDVLARLGFKNPDETANKQDTNTFPDLTNFAQEQKATPNSSPLFSQNEKELDAIQLERKRNLEQLRESIVKSRLMAEKNNTNPFEELNNRAALKPQPTPSVSSNSMSSDDFFKTSEESQLEDIQQQRQRSLEQLRENIVQSKLDLDQFKSTDENPRLNNSIDEEFEQFKATHVSEYRSDDVNITFIEQTRRKSKSQKKKRMIVTAIIAGTVLTGAAFAVKHFMDQQAEAEAEVITTPVPTPVEATPPATDTPAEQMPVDTQQTANGTPAPTEVAPPAPAPTEQPQATAPAPTVTATEEPKKGLVDDSLLHQPVASNPSLVQEELAKLQELEKQLQEQEALLEAQNKDAEKLIKLKEERIKLLEAQLTKTGGQ